MKGPNSQKPVVIESSMMNMTDREFRQLRELVYERLGINLTEKKRSMLIGRLQKLLRTSGFKNFQDYYEYLVNDSGMKAMTELINRVTTNYSFFYRGKSHFEYFVQAVLPEIVRSLKKRNSRDLRIWTAGCSTGEEPYMLTMLMREFFGNEYGQWDGGILATDISEKVLTFALQGIYPEDRTKEVPIQLRNKYFKNNELKTVSIIIPTLNAEKFIKGCLENIKTLKPLPLEVVVVDGGSIDATLDIVSLYDVKVVKSSAGRGIQIERGLRNVSGDVTAILHSDTCLSSGALGMMLESLNGSSETVGGALGQHFMDNRFGLTVIEILNDMRAGLFGISFGDQVQFFRTDAAKKYSLVPEIPLMEDVELSIRLLGVGKTAFLWGGVVVDNYKWNSGTFMRFIKVIYLLILFMLRRFRSSVETKDLYQMYYKDAVKINE